eukprot:symbB.v1.2.028042.t1/scaffold2921.1/size67189/3
MPMKPALESIAEAAEPPPKPVAKVEPPKEAAKDPFDSSGDEDHKDSKGGGTASAPKAEEPKKMPKKAKKPVKSKAAAQAAQPAAKDPFADSDSDGGAGGYPASAAKAAPGAADPFADSDTETGPLLPSPPAGATIPKRPSQVPQRQSVTSKSQSSGDAPKKVKKPKGRPGPDANSKAEDGTTSRNSSNKKPVGRPKKKAPAVAPAPAAAMDSDGEDAKF